ncbi:diphosphate--fructose-6-phosphate 1-phosphotransferase [Siminovitchia sp. FSL H7-0308]|uniref:Pyrophosphate--fructose 6-phosphate 1-phosphotransferase n=1 Tax=Siminovitchia thermophila TaxID=1245522 RepID=A0ABS2R265_9BACI|nr:diphosphate--fructose-6-phosphate 1-phosphotransferase [Siminovitchia thermophila]MBM7713726.1 6-phosphofructokinase 1 [Siminovitchia thermophila]
MKSNGIIVQSGGPTAVINNSVIGIIDEMKYSGFQGEIYGSVGGILGLINESFIELGNLSVRDRIRLRWTPGAALGTCRYKLTFDEVEVIIKNLKKHSIHFLFYIGGNGSMQVAKMIHDTAAIMKYDLAVIGIPKSIDNDLLGTDHSPGYGSAAKFLATSILDMKMDVASYPETNQLTIIETMGRHTGWLAAACSLTVSDREDSQTLIYIPEVPFCLTSCIEKVVNAHENKRNTFLITAEGLKNSAGQYINHDELEYDTLNRPKLGGVSTYLKEIIEAKTGIRTRAIETSILQRSSILLASKTDVDEAYEIGRESWKYALKGYSGVMIAMERANHQDTDYKMMYRPKLLKEVAGKEKYFPVEWYDKKNNIMTDEFIRYVEPLIQGEMMIPIENGLPVYKQVI